MCFADAKIRSEIYHFTYLESLIVTQQLESDYIVIGKAVDGLDALTRWDWRQVGWQLLLD